jgi:hypothetical protein
MGHAWKDSLVAAGFAPAASWLFYDGAKSGIASAALGVRFKRGEKPGLFYFTRATTALLALFFWAAAIGMSWSLLAS